MKISARNEDWREIVCCGLENQQIDFKSHQNWEAIGRVGRAKFARHAMALANTLGGYVVVGVGEDPNGIPNIFTGMTDEEASSFDPSTVGQTLNMYADPPVSLDIVRPMVDGRRYVILVVYPFKDIPHVCSENCEHELQRGAFYIRTPDARSKVASKASELHQLIRRALRNQRQMLGRMLRGILYEDKLADTRESELIPPLLERSRRHASEKLGRQLFHSSPFFETICYPETLFTDVRFADIRQAIDQLERPAIGDVPWPCTVDAPMEIFATNESICGVRMTAGKATVFWEMYCNGLFYMAAAFSPCDEAAGAKAIQGWELSQAAVFTLAALGQLFSLLNFPDAFLSITMRIPNSENALLMNIPFIDNDKQHLCRIMDVEVTRQRSPADLEGGAASETAATFFSELCERFNATFDAASLVELRLAFDRLLRP